MPVEINRQLNLVLEIQRGDRPLYVHSTPIPREVFKANYELIARTKADLFGHGTEYAIGSGPRIAALALRKAGARNAAERAERGDDGAETLLSEIRRLTIVIAPGTHGYEAIPVDIAIARNVLDQEDYEEVENALVFFTVLSAMANRSARGEMMDRLTQVVRGSRIESSSVTDFVASLRTLKQDATLPPAPLPADAPSAQPAPAAPVASPNPRALLVPH